MPVLNCHCGVEVRISPGRMLAMSQLGIVCPECGASLSRESVGRDVERGDLGSGSDESEIEFGEFPSDEPVSEELTIPGDIEFAAHEVDEPPSEQQEEDHLQDDDRKVPEPSPSGVSEAPTTAGAEQDVWTGITASDADVRSHSWRIQMAAISGSVIVHLVMLLILAAIIMPTLLDHAQDPIDVDLSMATLDLAAMPLVADHLMGAVTIDQAATSTPQINHADSVVAKPQKPLESVVINDPRQMPVASAPSLPSSSLMTPVTPVRRSDPSRGGLVQGSGSGEATQGILDSIKQVSSSGPVQIAWLMDASISMNVDRQEVAARLTPFYKEMALRDKKEALPLLSSVVTFGAQPVELVKTTRNFGFVTNAVAAMQNDPSGLENVMAGVQYCLRQYSSKKRTLVIVVFTDESGDDILKLEETIELCRQGNAIVHVVGPNAVFGSERGTHLWTDAESGFTFRLPVKRGPETSLPERMMLPYWHGMKFPMAAMNGNMVARDLPWYGGPLREGLLSGFGPYALTRLALQTGGTFTVLDRPGDQTVATLAELRPYIPDYSSAREYYSETQASPLRRAVSDAATLIWKSPELTPPPRTFLFARQSFYPFDAFVNYLNPDNFRKGFRDNLQTALKGSRAEMEIMEQALALFEAKNLEEEYAKETSLRWKAWYDVNYGRLLANMVRHLEYQLTCEQILESGALNPDTNHVMFVPSTQYKGGRISTSRAVQARRLLERCRQNNPGTQWDKLAEWELEYDLGMQVQQIVIPPPRPIQGTFVPVPATRPISFPRL